ncbi:hypothetical protein HDV01_005291 [Terramyces sp. JEL0728]|nr:hypothetical protein HDV01_005291 [Terramyces sp. JEL0728]
MVIFWNTRHRELRKYKIHLLKKEITSLNNVNSNFESAFEALLQGSVMRWDFRMENLELRLGSGNQVLKNVTGYIRAAKLTAIMGPSGCGKTTFMSVLCGKVQRTAGQLFISGKEIQVYKFKKLIGFVPQEDIMHRGLTVKENLLHSARIRLPSTWKSKEIEKHVDGIIEILKKRVNIGIELVSIPLCLFLDEPTSGLDSVGAMEVVDILSRISTMGITVVAVIHQPRTSFPEGVNEADILLDVLNNRGTNTIKDYTPDELADCWSEYSKNAKTHNLEEPIPVLSNISHSSSFRSNSVASREGRSSLAKDQQHYENFHSIAANIIKCKGAPLISQIVYCHNLAVLQFYRAPSLFYLPLFVSIICGIIVGLSLDPSYDSFIGLYQFLFLFLPSSPVLWKIPQFGLSIGFSSALAGSAAGVNVFGMEKPVYWRNASSGHSKVAYFIVK